MCKKASYYYVNFCLEKNLGAWRGGGGVKSGVYGIYILFCLAKQAYKYSVIMKLRDKKMSQNCETAAVITENM